MSSVSLVSSGPNNTTTVGFVSDPNGRDTLSLLFSCLTTLALCVWSAVHLNLPKHEESEIQYIWRYLRWSLLGLFGPELVIWAAWRQFISARALTKMVKEDDFNDSNGSAAKHWTMTHSFYACMGGFVFDTTSPEMARGPRFIPHWRQLHVTPRGVQFLAKCGLLPDIRAEDITDKSKTDGTGKFLCCFQVVWMIYQVAARLAVGLPVTPLEINTLGHVFCALLTFLLWWSKPRWIKEPTLLRGDWVRPICALMYMSSQVSETNRRDRDILRDFGVKSEISSILYLPATITESIKLDGDTDNSTSKEMSALLGREPRILSMSNDTETDDERANGVMVPRALLRRGTQSHKLSQSPDAFSTTDDSDSSALKAARWRLACEAIAKFPTIQERLEHQEMDQGEARYREALRLYPEMPQKVSEKFIRQHVPSETPNTYMSQGFVCAAEELVIEKPRNWPGNDLLNHIQGHMMGIILWTGSTAYGAVHLSGWNGWFPTTVEAWFWRGSALYLVFSGLLWSFLNLLGQLSGTVWWFWYDILAGYERRVSFYVIYVLCCIGGTLYVVARVYLVVEAFLSLRALPASAYESPTWVISVPHI